MLRSPLNSRRRTGRCRYAPRMNRLPTALVALAAATILVAGCSPSDDSDNPQSSTSPSPSPSPTPGLATNQRGAIEVNLGQPVTISDDNGTPVLTITDSRLDTSGCADLSPEVVQAKFAATVKTGSIETPEWLWASDFYYVDARGKVAQNLEVSQMVDGSTPCRGSVQFIDVPPNSTKDGSPTLVVPKIAVAIGYHLDAGGVDRRVEWKLPQGWQPVTSTTTATEPPVTTTDAPAETTVPETTTTNGIPPGWDKDGNGQIDTDAPVG